PKPPPETPAPKPSANSLPTFDFATVTVNSTGQIANRSQGQARVFTDNLGDGITIDMIAIPGGSFVMGSPSTEAGRSSDEGPQHTVTVAPFFMGKYEVTQAQYQAVMGNNPSRFKGAKRPVENVSWDEAVEFCRKLTQKTGKSYRLPSEAEWEYACRAGTTTPFYFGDTITPELVNYDGNYPYGAAPKGLYRQQTTDVGSFPPNSFGLYDMHGNVWEWCSDKWHGNYSGAPTDGSSWETGTDNNRVLRGGSWNLNAVNCRSANRYSVL
ncbi:MAG: formylglycine-generating enzyme family protein, partial [Oscillatoriales cyanobacterium]